MNYGQLPGWFDRLVQRFMPTPETVAEAELKDAKLQILESQTQAEAAALAVKIFNVTTQHHLERIVRLSEFLGHDKIDVSDLMEVHVSAFPEKIYRS